MIPEKFDRRYYERFYFTPSTRVAEPAYFDRLARFVAAYLGVLDCSVDRILDAGCGAGLMHRGLRRAWPRARIDAFDASAYACERYGWQQATLEQFETRTIYDLVICHDVIQYLDRKSAAAVLAKLARFTRTALFFGVLTSEDWHENCDQQRTDNAVHLRSSAWYRRHLRATFHNAGGGLYIKRDADVVLFSLESI